MSTEDKHLDVIQCILLLKSINYLGVQFQISMFTQKLNIVQGKQLLQRLDLGMVYGVCFRQKINGRKKWLEINVLRTALKL